ncbi:cupin domain-containing protein [Pigmentiphaga sp. H8]|uniref:cupin domain-containing protein n=1 Tax=unclassified Pigmentiphaga TaxID=2626614 RepID=UPI000F593402|nr:cupin domain-containing protein [Pigmentiphaga sp. H8]AZG10744.1 cupin domain-containing protein [Pigmentiphaga sp. H8]
MKGHFIAFSHYLERTAQPVGQPAIWRKLDVEAALTAQPLSSQRLTRAMALTRSDESEAFALNGSISLIVQALGPGERGRMHSHSFWHLYFVLKGQGASLIGGERITWSDGDSFYVPAWVEHDLQNLSDTQDAIVYSVQNLPEQASNGSLMRKEPGGGYVHIASDLAEDVAADVPKG